MTSRFSLSLVLLTSAWMAAASAQKQEERASLTSSQFEPLHRLIKPGPGEARWAQVPWMPSTDLWAARQKAAEEGKPLFLWYMAGEPLGSC